MMKPLPPPNDKSARNLFGQGNESLRTGDYRKAITLYAQVLAQHAELPNYLSANLSIARQKYRLSRQAVMRPNVGVCGWDLGHNAAGRVYTLATLYETFANVQIIGSVFPDHGRDIWEPIRATSIAKNAFIVEDERTFIEQALKIVAEHPCDIVHLSKTRIPNIFFGIMYKLLWDAKVLMDIDDEELAFIDEESPLRIEDYLKRYNKLPELTNLAGKEWTRLAVGLAHEFDGLTVANHALQRRYGGQIICHARNEMYFQHSPQQRRANRTRFRIAPDTKVILFLGTPRSYKGLIETAQAIAKLKRRDIVFAIVGDFPDDSLKVQLQAITEVNYLFIGNQPITEVSTITSIGDACVLLQDTQSRAANYQTPAKLSDALASGLPVLATETPALADAFMVGALLPISQDNLVEQLTKIMDNDNIAQNLRLKGLNFFRRELSFSANVPRLSQAVQKSEKKTLSTEVDALGRYICDELFPTYRRFTKIKLQTVCEPLTDSEPIPDKKIAIAIHVDHQELWPDIAKKLRAIPRAFDMFVTTTLELAESVSSAVQRDFPDARIATQPNIGMDILPFLHLIPTLVEEGYLAVCKLHTQKRLKEQDELWRNFMFDTLIGDTTTFDQITTAFVHEPSLQLAGPASLYLSAQKLVLDDTATLEAVYQEFEGRSLPNVEWGFFSGAMFWARPALLGKLTKHIEQYIDKLETDYKKDSQFVLTIERVFGLLPALQHGQIGLLHPSRSDQKHILQITSAYNQPNQASMSELVIQYENLDRDYTLLDQSDLFDSAYYRQQSPNLIDADIDLVRHYLLIGRFQGKTPNPDFDPAHYIECYGNQIDGNKDPFLHYLRKGAKSEFLLRTTKEQEEQEIPSFRYRALNTLLIDWDALAKQKREQDRVSIIIPVYNNLKLTRECIESLYAHTPVDRFELIVVNNGSKAATRMLLNNLAEKHNNLKVLHNEENFNFALGCNLGLAASNCEIVIFLNNDIIVTDNWLEPLIEPLSRAEISIVQPRLLFPDGTIQCMGVVFSRKSPLGYPIYTGMRPDESWAGRSRNFQAVTGACMTVRAEDFIKVRGFDPIYINGQEDIDLCLRLNEPDNKGLKKNCYYASESKIYHHESQSHNREKFILQNRKIFIKRWAGKIGPDDKIHYAEDMFEVVAYLPEAEENDEKNLLNIWHPHLRYSPFSNKKLTSDDLQKVGIQFDCEYYKQHYPDAGKSGVDPFKHYLIHGFSEFRKPNAAFDPNLFCAYNLGANNSIEDFWKFLIKNGATITYPKELARGEIFPELEEVISSTGPLFSIVMPTWNRKNVIADAIDSIIDQCYKRWELHIVDDGSTDGTESFLTERYAKEIASERIFIHESGHQGVSNARNIGLDHARGEWIAYLDSDNKWHANYLAYNAFFISKFQNTKTLYSRLDVFDTPRFAGKKFYFDHSRLLKTNFIDLNAYVHHRSVFEELGGFDTNLHRLVDWDMALRHTKKYRPIYLPITFVQYHLDDSLNNITKTIPYTPNYNTLINKQLIDWNILSSRKFVKDQVSIVIPVYNRADLTQQCLEEIRKYTNVEEIEVVIVDNGSNDGTAQYMQLETEKYSWLSYIRNDNNYGFSVGCNIGAAHAVNEYVLFLNNDTMVTANWLDHLLQTIREELYVGMVGAKLLYPDDTIQFAGMAFNDQSKIPYHIYRGYSSGHPSVNKKREFQALTGACLLMRTDDFISVGGFDPHFVNGGEDLDLSFKVSKKLGKRIIYNPNSVVYHLEGKTEGRSKMIMENRMLFVDKWMNEIYADDKTFLHEDGFSVRNYSKKGTEQHGIYAAYYPELEEFEDDKAVNKINIGFVTMWYKRGITYHTLQLIKALDSQMFTPYVFSRWESDKFSNCGDVHIPNVINAGQDPTTDEIVKWIKTYDIKVLIQMEVHPKDWKRLRVIKEQTDVSLIIYENLDVMYRERIPDYSIADYFLTNTYYATNFWQKNYNNKPVIFIPWGIEPLDSPQKVLKDGDPVEFLHIAGWGGLNNRKNTGLLIKAFSQTDVHAVLNIYMQCTLDTLGSEIVEILNTDSRIKLHQGSVDNIFEVYQYSDVLLWPSKREGLGLPIVEALAHGLPVVVSDGLMMKEWIRDGIHGLIVASKDQPDKRVLPEQDVNPFDLSVKIKALSSDYSLVKRLKETVMNEKHLWLWDWQKLQFSKALNCVASKANLDDLGNDIPEWRKEIFPNQISELE